MSRLLSSCRARWRRRRLSFPSRLSSSTTSRPSASTWSKRCLCLSAISPPSPSWLSFAPSTSTSLVARSTTSRAVWPEEALFVACSRLARRSRWGQAWSQGTHRASSAVGRSSQKFWVCTLSRTICSMRRLEV